MAEVESHYTRIHKAAYALYMAGRWSLPEDVMTNEDQAKMWEDMREAMNLPAGHSTNAGVPGQ
jgi:hypothetical protein